MRKMSQERRVPFAVIASLGTMIILLIGIFASLNQIKQAIYRNVLEGKKNIYAEDVENIIANTEERRTNLKLMHPDWTDDQIKEQIEKDLRNYIYNMDITDGSYVWVEEVVNYDGGDDYAIRLIHPNMPETEGNYLSTNTEDGAGNKPYLDELEGIKKDGSVFIEYQFKKYNSNKQEQKVTYSALYKDYNWIICRGITLDEIDAIVESMMKESYPFIIIVSIVLSLWTVMLISYVINEIKEQQQKKYDFEHALMREEINDSRNESRKKSEFLMNVSHDMSTPMNNIIAYTNMIVKYDDDDEKRREYVEKAQETEEQLLNMLNSVNDMANIENGNISIDEQLVDSHEMYNDIGDKYRSKAEEKKIKYEVLDSITHQYIYADVEKINKIFRYMLSNSIKFTGKGGYIKFTVTEYPTSDPEVWMFESVIEDNGIGMSAEMMESFVERINNKKQAYKVQEDDGNWVDFVVMHRLISMMNGKFDMQSREGVGTKMKVTIPHKIVDEK
ncbi:MAG: cache domain-containing protein [Lachnospiraceae bacterium]|nr:cache domain-containing protein [Lachnospiraceae bacterium]